MAIAAANSGYKEFKILQTMTVSKDDLVLHLPTYGVSYTNNLGFDSWAEFFERAAPLKVEICSGNGHWIRDCGLTDPQANWVGIEIKKKRIYRVLKKLKAYPNLHNVRLVCGDARTAFAHYFRPNSVTACFLNFPDPWPKDRHQKHRVMTTQICRDITTALLPGGTFTLATDHHDYLVAALELLGQTPGLTPDFDAPHFKEELTEHPTTQYESRWREEGRKIYYTRWRKA